MLQPLHVIGLGLVILGALNWGLIGLLQIDVIALIGGGHATLLSRVICAVIGLAGLMLFITTVAVYSDWRRPSFPRR